MRMLVNVTGVRSHEMSTVLYRWIYGACDSFFFWFEVFFGVFGVWSFFFFVGFCVFEGVVCGCSLTVFLAGRGELVLLLYCVVLFI